MSEAQDDGFVPTIDHDDFRRGLPHGRFRVVVDPARARPYVMQRTRVRPVAIALIGIGAAVALSGHPWVGLVPVALGVIGVRAVRHHAPRIALHLALSQRDVYDEVTHNGVMEVRQAG